MRRGHVLVVRLDNDGDVLLSGPAVRAVAAASDRVTLVCGPRGRQAAALLPGVDDVLVWDAPWVGYAPDPLDPDDVLDVVARLRALDADEAVVLTSFHQSPLPMALLLRMAGVRRLAATSVDYPGSLLDVRHRVDDTWHEVEKALSLTTAAGFPLPPGDDGRLAVRHPLPDVRHLVGEGSFVVLHPAASVPARAPSPDVARSLAGALTAAGHRVVVTGAPSEAGLTAHVAGGRCLDLGGRTGYPELAAVLAAADAVVVGNTGPAHLAAAVRTPVVSLFAPVVDPGAWGPYGVPTVVLGDLAAPCRGTRARTCPVPGHPCLDSLTPEEVLAAVAQLTDGRAAGAAPAPRPRDAREVPA
ncbi:glycosyltransferase family 9 protein [Vallicoccus soli]|uniref:Glycosyltransferase family 9 protein n=1 Tax=Vallicoccus soli TaxID=2339232 RepID=A0A3A3Z0D6_9ACTN|nr:glycosyltransferase family 9 protein [Vallicoccus soli]RJK93802.1 glycosyltransferase family 9 protein [Vallicoccus soli]